MYKYASKQQDVPCLHCSPKAHPRAVTPTTPKNIRAETNPHQQNPEYIQHTPKTGTHGEQAPPHPPVYTTTTHQRPHWTEIRKHTDKRRGAKPNLPSALEHHTKPAISGSPTIQQVKIAHSFLQCVLNLFHFIILSLPVKLYK